MRKFVALLAAFALLPMAASAASINYSTSGSTVYTTAMTGFQTDGSRMVGMQISLNGGAPVTWGAMGSTWGVDLGGVVLTESADTFGGLWSLTVADGATVNSLFFNGIPGRTTFDRSFSPEPGTPGSGAGWDLSGFANFPGTIGVQYLHPLALGAIPPVGDEYVQMLADFSAPTGGALGAGSYSFIQDTDNATTDISNDPVVPEPGSLLLLGTGLVAAARRLRRREA